MKLNPDTHSKIADTLPSTFANMDDEDATAVIELIAERVNGLGDTPEDVVEANRLAGVGEALRSAFGGGSGAASEQPTEALAAAGGRSGAVARMALAQRRPQASPEQRPPVSAHRAVLRAMRPMGGRLASGEVIDDRMTLARGMADALNSMSPTRKGTGPVILASATWDYPPERTLGSDAESNVALIDAVCSPQALTASGGVCAPTDITYELPTWASAARPLRDFLPAFDAGRGGLRFSKPKDISELAGATGIWPETTDFDPGAETKPIISIACATPEEVLVDAVPTRLGIGNMQMKFAPEVIAMNTDLAMAAAARKAEINLLEKIQTAALKDVTSAKVIGATRDLLTAITQAVSAFRYTHRIDRDVSLSAIFPSFVLDIIKTDLARETAHQQGGDWNALEIPDERAIALIKNCGLNPCFVIDGLPEPESKTFPLQGFAAQTASGAIHAYPTKVCWNLFPEGSVQFLDGGRLDLGVVRDATLDSTNDAELFVESFEQIAARGFTNSIVQYVTELCANGQSGATATVSGCA